MCTTDGPDDSTRARLADLEAPQARLAKNEHVYRTINENIRDAANTPGPEHRFEFLCECSDSACRTHLHMTLQEYESLRRRSDHFAVLPRHERAGIEVVVERTDRFLVVEKVRAGRDVARHLWQREQER